MNCGLCLQFFGLLNILAPGCCFLLGQSCKTCYKYQQGNHYFWCVQPKHMCDGYSDCYDGADESACGGMSKHCTEIQTSGQLKCSLPRVIEVDDAWVDYQQYCVRRSYNRHSVYSDASLHCNNRQTCSISNKGRWSVKILYHCIDKNVETTKQPSELFLNTTPLFPKHTSRIINHKDRSSKLLPTVSMSSHTGGNKPKETVSTHNATSTATPKSPTAAERHIQTSSKHTVKIKSTLFSTHTANNTMHTVADNRNSNTANNNILRSTMSVMVDTISTVNINQISTDLFLINKTFIKHNSKTDYQKQKSQVANTAGSVTGVMFVICVVLLFVLVRQQLIKRGTSKGRELTTESTSDTQSRKFSNSLEGQNNVPLYSCVDNLRQSELGQTVPQSKSFSNIGYDEVSDFSVQNADYDHIERIGRRADVDMVYSLTTYQKTEDDYDISCHFNETLRSYQETSIYD